MREIKCIKQCSDRKRWHIWQRLILPQALFLRLHWDVSARLCEHLHTNTIASGMKLYFMTDTHSLREHKVHVCSNNVLIKMTKWMSPYWDNKSLLTPYLTLPDSLSSTFRLFPSLLLKIHAFPTWYLVWKGRGGKFGKTWIQTKVDRVKKTFKHVLYHLRHCSCF